MKRYRIGKRAYAYVAEHGCQWREDGDIMVPEHETPDAIARTLDRVFGRAETIDRGEVGYWRIPRDAEIVA